MKGISVIEIDIAKNVIQLHGSDSTGKVLFKNRTTKDKFLSTLATMPKCLIGMDTGAYYKQDSHLNKIKEAGYIYDRNFCPLSFNIYLCLHFPAGPYRVEYFNLLSRVRAYSLHSTCHWQQSVLYRRAQYWKGQF